MERKPLGSPIDYALAGRCVGRDPGAEYMPRELRQRAVDYFEFMRNRVWNKIELLKSGLTAGMPCEVPTQSPLSLRGFLVFTGMSRQRWQRYKSDPAYSDICEWVELAIETQNFEGAMVGVYDSGLTAKTLKLAERTETTVEVHRPRDLTTEEAAAFRMKLNDEY